MIYDIRDTISHQLGLTFKDPGLKINVVPRHLPKPISYKGTYNIKCTSHHPRWAT
ncbi:hypothetical protein SESBI_37299 [Sesbania bispinosa]|nr:hypothetical protein SESBI_37299 [Sesbania bispinosa]